MFRELWSGMRGFLLRTFDIRTGEPRRVWLMSINIFLLIQCLWIIKPVINAQFISRAGVENLPLVFLLVAVTALAFSKVYSRLLQRLSLQAVIARTHEVSIASLILFGLLLQFGLFVDWMAYLFYIGIALFGLVTTSQFWLQANMLFSSLQAKRLFGLIGAGAIAGGISGGYLTSILTQFTDTKYILYLAAGFLLISAMVNRRIWMKFLPGFHRKPRASKTLQEYPLRIIRNSKHLTYLALIIGISVLVAKLIEFQFSAIASVNIQDPEKLTAFFGFWFSTANLLALGIQLIFTRRMVGFLGVGRSLFILPGALIVSTLAVLKYPVLWAGTTLKVLDIALKQSVNKAVIELLILPVPMATKNQAKTFIDVFVDTTATGIGGLLLIFLIRGMDFSIQAVSVLILFLIAVWIYFALKARREYLLSFQRQLGIPEKPLEQKDAFRTYTIVREGIRRTLQSGSDDRKLKILESIEESKDPVLMQDVIPLLSHESPKVRLAALGVLYYHPDHSVKEYIEPCLKDPDDQVRTRAFAALLAHTRHDRVQFINKHLGDKDPAINSAALVGLATETRDNPAMQQQFDLEQRLREKLDQANHAHDQEGAVNTTINVIRSIGFGRIKVFYPLLLEFMQDPNPAISRRAIIAAGNTSDLRFVKTLLSFLCDDNTRTTAQKALAKFNPSDLIPILIEVSSDNATPLDLLLQLPALTKTMDTQQAIDFLFGLLVQHSHPVLKFETLEALHAMKGKFPHLTITGKKIMPYLMEEAALYKDTLALNYAAHQGFQNDNETSEMSQARRELIELLEQKLDNDLKRIFWLLGLSYPPGIIIPLFKDLRHKDPEIRMSTVELLDNVLDPGLKKVVISIVESAMQDELSSDDLGRMDVDIQSEIACYETILKGKDEELKKAVVKLIEATGKPEYGYLIT